MEIHYKFSAEFVKQRAEEPHILSEGIEYTIAPAGDNACIVTIDDERDIALFFARELELPWACITS